MITHNFFFRFFCKWFVKTKKPAITSYCLGLIETSKYVETKWQFENNGNFDRLFFWIFRGFWGYGPAQINPIKIWQAYFIITSRPFTYFKMCYILFTHLPYYIIQNVEFDGIRNCIPQQACIAKSNKPCNVVRVTTILKVRVLCAEENDNSLILSFLISPYPRFLVHCACVCVCLCVYEM